MPSHYKTKATAIKHILAGESFWTAKFKNFWEDKEVVKEAVILNPYVFDHPKCGVKNEWRWDEEFTNEIFERSKCPHPFGFNGSRYLSSSFANNRKKVLKALKDGKSEVCLYMDEAFYSDPAIIKAMPTAFGAPCYIDWPMGLCLDRSTNSLQLHFTEDCNQSPSSFRFANQ
ncbi:hypothetical protein [Roseateles sp. PN1]|uniref:hypothetical protein n=1 Tax=Roseateles sp. PN1 TaxID=3137372 RepID=UPI00313984C0